VVLSGVSGHYDQSVRAACGTRIPVDGIDDVFKAALVSCSNSCQQGLFSAIHDEPSCRSARVLSRKCTHQHSTGLNAIPPSVAVLEYMIYICTGGLGMEKMSIPQLHKILEYGRYSA